MSGYLKRIRITLTALSPVHIGSGEVIGKKEYIHDRREGVVYYPDLRAMTGALKEARLFDQYERFLLGNRPGDLCGFLTEHHVDWRDWCGPPISVRDVADETFNQINAFIKDPYGLPYLPGSGVKGAFRTVMLNHEAQNRHVRNIEGLEPRTARWKAGGMEQELLYRLRRNPERPNSVTNDMMAAFRFSDSGPVPRDALTICRKIDAPVTSARRHPKPMPIFRECLKPGTVISLTLTADLSLWEERMPLPNFPALLESFNHRYYQEFQRYFPHEEDTRPDVIYLGGGTGFLTKTMLLGLPDSGRRLTFVADHLQNKFRAHKHDRDKSLGISPRTLKLTEFEGKLYEMGRCAVEFAEL